MKAEVDVVQLNEVLKLLSMALDGNGDWKAVEQARRMLEEILLQTGAIPDEEVKAIYRRQCGACKTRNELTGKDGRVGRVFRRKDADGTFETETCDSCGYTVKHPAALKF